MLRVGFSAGGSRGTGGFGHLMIDNAPMLLRSFHSLREYSQQGFEASHKGPAPIVVKGVQPCQCEKASSSNLSGLLL